MIRVNKVLWPIVAMLASGLLLSCLPRAHAFNPITDIRDNLVWTFGKDAQAGRGYDFSAKKWDDSALAEICTYRFLSLSYGVTFLDTNSSGTDTLKLGILSNFFFGLFKNQPTPAMAWMENLNIGPSFAIPVFSGSTGHKGVLLLDMNYRFGS